MSAEPFIAVVTGMRAEARIASGMGGVRTIVGGGNGAHLVAEVERAIGEGTRGLLSFGIAGGLAPGLAPGAIIVAREVVQGSERWLTDSDWSTRFLTLLPEATHGVLAGSDSPVTTVAGKSDLHALTGAAAVDMESHLVARLAHRHGVPYAALRVIADGHDRALPQAALAGFGADGGIDIMGVLGALLRRPHELPALIRLSADSRAAFAALFRCGSRLSAGSAGGLLRPSLGLADLG